eukprot:TRINITY_DN1059_c0_g1_i1.p1 TRINITY_DN1059_c0_g1~~TRINITY_DN1059_c0_g1_i1.p1  ORF type:complete len:326 (+),score=19.55 TRINITY_DN1059_c0_g1_i1:1856-2833(+)
MGTLLFLANKRLQPSWGMIRVFGDTLQRYSSPELITEVSGQQNKKQGFDVIQKYMGAIYNQGFVMFAWILVKQLRRIPYIDATQYTKLWDCILDRIMSQTTSITREMETAFIEIWRAMQQNQLLSIFASRQNEIYSYFFNQAKTNREYKDMVLYLLRIDDAMCEFSLESGILSVIEPDVRRRTYHSDFAADVLTHLMTSRPIYLDAVLAHSVWKTMKEKLFKGRSPLAKEWISMAILRSCKHATDWQIWMLAEEEKVIEKAVQEVLRNGWASETSIGFESAVERIVNVGKRHEKCQEIEKCLKIIKDAFLVLTTEQMKGRKFLII